MLSEELLNYLKKHWRGVLGLVDVDKPYCIPMAYIIYNNDVYLLFVKEGRKTECLKRNRNACYLVELLEHGKHVSILIEGYLEKIHDLERVKKVLELFVKHIVPRDAYLRGFEFNIDELARQYVYSDTYAGIYRFVIKNYSVMIK
ncbi:MAG: hypothetical protein B6V02_01080 [Thermoprotei archaeon ex4572_64]|nr:MAG: hypothetical protein B6V02_01080 [Thermoprotei archaeon ex4572_64]